LYAHAASSKSGDAFTGIYGFSLRCGGKMLRFRVFISLAIICLGTQTAVLGQDPKTTNSAKNDKPTDITPAEVVQQQKSTDGSADHPALQHRNPRYRVNRDDVLQINFALSPELNQKVTIQPDGYITLQSIGSVYIAGMTVPEVVAAIKKASANILNDPIVDVDLLDFQRAYFTVTGQVSKPGQYDLRHDTNVSEAIAVAGGLLPTAKTQVFVYHRVSPNWMEVKKYNLKEVLNGKNVNEVMEMQPGDMVFVPEKFIATFRKYVPYTLGIYANPQSLF
jgi:protein involved in polysaccharide export with SLBB domain